VGTQRQPVSGAIQAVAQRNLSWTTASFARFVASWILHSGDALSVQLIEQGLGVLHVGLLEALGEGIVDSGQRGARLVAAALPE
jgi:hypothetical protein